MHTTRETWNYILVNRLESSLCLEARSRVEEKRPRVLREFRPLHEVLRPLLWSHTTSVTSLIKGFGRRRSDGLSRAHHGI
jgi:hypothetical protein